MGALPCAVVEWVGLMRSAGQHHDGSAAKDKPGEAQADDRDTLLVVLEDLPAFLELRPSAGLLRGHHGVHPVTAQTTPNVIAAAAAMSRAAPPGLLWTSVQALLTQVLMYSVTGMSASDQVVEPRADTGSAAPSQ